MDISISSIDVAILCGGRGTRLRKVIDDRPKPMAEINNQPFLDILIKYVASYGFKRFILCTGYKSTFITEYYKKQNDELTYIISEETSALGTAGAIANAKHLFTSNPILVLNGDSYCPVNLHKLLKFHFSKSALGSIALSEVKSPQGFGVITLNQQEQIIGFSEKPQAAKPGIINAGIYALNREVIANIPTDQPMSMETELFPPLIEKGGLFGFASKENLIDIGTPERLKTAKKLLPQYEK